MGGVSYISVDQSAKNYRGVVVASESGVLAVLTPSDDSISKSGASHMAIPLHSEYSSLNIVILINSMPTHELLHRCDYLLLHRVCRGSA